jgi:hypothetical protein
MTSENGNLPHTVPKPEHEPPASCLCSPSRASAACVSCQEKHIIVSPLQCTLAIFSHVLLLSFKIWLHGFWNLFTISRPMILSFLFFRLMLVLFILFYCVLFLGWGKVSLHWLGRTHTSDSPLLASQVLELQAHTTTPGLFLFFNVEMISH